MVNTRKLLLQSFVKNMISSHFETFLLVGLFVPTLAFAGILKSLPIVLRVVPPLSLPIGTPETPTGTIPQLGALVHDGPNTPEQISMLIPVTGTLDKTLKANVIYKKSSENTWYQAHPLHRMRPEFADNSPYLREGFAGVITDLIPGVSYDVQVAVKQGAITDVKKLTTTTRLLPSESGNANKTIAAGSTLSQINASISALKPGDVFEFANGIYNLNSSIIISVKGTVAQPIVIRGASRSGVQLINSRRVIQFQNAENIIIERMTLEGSGVDSGVNSSSVGIELWDGYNQKNITIRNTTIQKVDMGIIASHQAEGIMVYDNTLLGNNKWDQDYFAYNTGGTPGAGDGTRDGEQNIFWNDDALRLSGHGNVGFNNTIYGFGDAMEVIADVDNVGVHFYRNDVTMTGDDGFEGDYGVRNMTFYDNRMENTMTFVSFDPLYGGPAFIFRNIAINVRRGPLKLNNTNTGFMFYNNTVVTIDGANNTPWTFIQYNNGDINAWSYCNNIMIRKNVSGTMALESGGENPIDFTNNAWYPNGSIWWSNSGGSFSNLAAAFAGLPQTTPLYGTSTKRHDKDLIIESNPFVTDIIFPGADYRTLVPVTYTPILKTNSVAKGKGRAIPGITDGFSGNAPDIGALIEGRPIPVYGDRRK